MKVINKSMELISSGTYKIKDELYGEYSVTAFCIRGGA